MNMSMSHDEHLLLVPPADGSAIAAAVTSLLDAPDLRTRLGRAAQARASAEFDQRAVARVSLETYAVVLAQKSSRRAGILGGRRRRRRLGSAQGASRA